MLKRLPITSLLLWVVFSVSRASTDVSGTLSGGQWDLKGSPYIIQGKVVLSKGATLQIGSGVQVVFQPQSGLEVKGTLEVAPAASHPAVFDMSQGGLQSYLVLNGASANIVNTQVVGGIFLARNSRLILESSEVTKGSGLYLQGKTRAKVRANKFYGNAAGMVMDGGSLKADFEFNVFTDNTHGLDLRNYASLRFRNNIVYGNWKADVAVAKGKKAYLGGNAWTSTDPAQKTRLKIKGHAVLQPEKNIKSVTLAYIQAMFPDIYAKKRVAPGGNWEGGNAEGAPQAGKGTAAPKAELPSVPVPGEEAVPPAVPETVPGPGIGNLVVPPVPEEPGTEVVPIPPSVEEEGNPLSGAVTVPLPPLAPPLPEVTIGGSVLSALSQEIPPPPSLQGEKPVSKLNPPTPEVTGAEPQAMVTPSVEVPAPPSLESTPAKSEATPAASTSSAEVPPPPSPDSTPVKPEATPASSTSSVEVPPPPSPESTPVKPEATPAAATSSVEVPAPPAMDQAKPATGVEVPAPPAEEAGGNPVPTEKQKKALESLRGVQGEIGGGKDYPDLGVGLGLQDIEEGSSKPAPGSQGNVQSENPDVLILPPMKQDTAVPTPGTTPSPTPKPAEAGQGPQ